MASPNLNIGHVSAGSNTKEVTINAAVDALDAATQGRETLTFAANVGTVNVTTFRGAFEFVTPATLSATGTLTVPLINRLFAIDNRASPEDLVVKGSSGTTATVAAGGSSLLRVASSGVYEFAQVSGASVTSVVGATGVISLANLVSGGVAPTASPTFTGTVDADSATAVLVPTATFGDSTTKAANTAHLQEALASLALKPAANAATGTDPLPANTYINGTLGVGASLTATANGALVVDDVAVVAGDLILVTAEADSENNGLYEVIDPGDASNPYILMRSTGMDLSDKFYGALVGVVTGGTSFGESIWICTSPAGLVVGTDPVTFASFSGGGASQAYVDAKTWDFSALPASVQTVPVTAAFSGTPGDAQMVHIPIVMTSVLPANFAGTQTYAATAPTASAAFDVDYIHSGTVTAIGTITFGIGSQAGTLSVQSGVTLAAGNVLRITAPTPDDATLADVGISLLLERT